MENKFEEKIEGLESHKWISVDDCSEELGVSRVCSQIKMNFF